MNGFQYTWDFGDGNTSGSPNPSHTYDASGVYTVTLIARNGTCSDTVSYDVTFIITSLEDVLQDEWTLTATPNPFQDVVLVNYDLGTNAERSHWWYTTTLVRSCLAKISMPLLVMWNWDKTCHRAFSLFKSAQDQKISQVLKVTKVK